MFTIGRIRLPLASIVVLGCVPALPFCAAAQAQPQEAVTISLTEAIHRAQQNEPLFATAAGMQKSAAIDSYLAKAALLPSAVYHNQMIYTQPNGKTDTGPQGSPQELPIFIANNGVHEYVSQASITEMIGLKQIEDARAASANAARASAELEIARRGLVAAVVGLYYAVSDAESKQRLLADSLIEAQSFTNVTQEREAAREIAHADVVKAELQQQQKERDLNDAIVAADRARLELGVLLFPDPRTAYKTVPPDTASPLPTRDDVDRMASANNPEIRSALAGLRAGNAGVASARAAYLPDVGLNFSYGIDAPQVAKRGPDDVLNLGYSITGTLDIPVWDWFSTQKRVKQSEIRRDIAKVNLTAAQRRLIAELGENYAEASMARNQLNLLDQSVKTAEESLRLTKLRYSAGESTALEVVDAQNAYLAAKTARADGIVRYQVALANLQILTGTL